MDTAAGTNRKAIFAIKKSDIPFTHDSLINPNLSDRVSNSIPIILDGSFTLVK